MAGVSVGDDSGMERMIISKCYSKITLSSNQKTLSK